MLIWGVTEAAVGAQADAQARASLDAAQIAADAAAQSALILSAATVVAALIAAGVAGFVAWKVGSKQLEITKDQIALMAEQTKIQAGLSDLEKTKIRLELVERRSQFIGLISNLFGEILVLLASEKGRSLSNFARTEEASKNLYDRFESARFIFDATAEPCLTRIPETVRNVQMMTKRFIDNPALIANYPTDEYFGRASDAVTCLMALSEEYLEPQTYPFGKGWNTDLEEQC